MSTPLETKSKPPRDTMFLTGSKSKRLIVAFGVIILLGFFLVNFIQQNYVVPIIMYHSVNPKAIPENRLVISPEAFERQMYFLKRHRYNVLPLELLASLIKDRKKIPPRAIAITFDDGYKDNYIFVLPILKKYNFPATKFVIINEIGRPDRLSWEEIKAMQDTGLINFGSHGLDAEPLINIKSEEELRRQIFDSQKILEEKLGQKVIAFSYPEGRFNAKIRQLVINAGYKLAVATNPGKKFASDDVFVLKRLRISSTSNNLFVFGIETSGYYNFIREHRHK